MQRRGGRGWWLLLLGVCLWATPIVAVEYGTFIVVAGEEDLLALLENGEIDAAEFEELTDLLATGVDLNTADRNAMYALPNLSLADVAAILAHRRRVGQLDGPGELAAAGVLSHRQADALEAFLTERRRQTDRGAIGGHVRLRTLGVVGDDGVPPAALDTRLQAPYGMDSGFAAVLTRQRLGTVRFDSNRGVLSADAPKPRVEFPKFFVGHRNERWSAIGGTYRTGFAERLVFDTTGRDRPEGWVPDVTVTRESELKLRCRQSAGELNVSPCAGVAGAVRTAPDFSWRELQRGAAVAVGLGPGSAPVATLHAFGSYQRHRLQQSELVDAGRCPDPRADDDPACAPPPVLHVDRAAPFLPAPAWKQSTLPRMFAESLGGGYLTARPGAGLRLGVGGYGANVRWLVRDIDLDFQEWSRRPYGGAYGALGAHVGWTYGRSDLGMEVARSFDGQPSGGGYGAVLRETLSWRRHELEMVLRFYDAGYANPYARAVAAADEFEGLRTRDEAGGRLRYSGRVAERLELRARIDLWRPTRRRVPKLEGSVRADVRMLRWWTPGLWLDYADKNLRAGGAGQCFEAGVDTGAAEEPSPCGGSRVALTGRHRFEPHKRVVLHIEARYAWIDDPSQAGRRRDLAVWMTVRTHPMQHLRLATRLRYDNQGLGDPTRGATLLWWRADADVALGKGVVVGVGYDLRAFVDNRDSTRARSPHPEHWLRGQVAARF